MSYRGLKMGHFQCIIDRMGVIYGARKLLYPSLFLLYFEMLACMSISLSLTTAFTLNTLYFTIIFIEFECIL